MIRPLAVSTGDPAGIGPEISVRALAAVPPASGAVLFGDAGAVIDLGRSAGLYIRRVEPSEAVSVGPGEVAVVHVASWAREMVDVHAETAEGGCAQLAALDAAVTAVTSRLAGALVTAPMSKAAVALSGASFTGHTEHLAQRAGLDRDAVTMLFLGARLSVGVATTHVSVEQAVASLSVTNVVRTVMHLVGALNRLGPKGRPRSVVVTGANPHAGEGGLFGRQERDVIGPAVEQARVALASEGASVTLTGPIGAETAFRLAAEGAVDGVAAMLHDQATIACKLLDWTTSVNVTWGLPFVRTSVDHGVAYDAARRGAADPSGMIAAIAMAERLVGAAGA